MRTINADMNAGANLTLSDMRVSLHVGAHADAPSHYLADGEDISVRRLDLYLGRCIVVDVDVARGERIMPDHVADKSKRSARRAFFSAPERSPITAAGTTISPASRPSSSTISTTTASASSASTPPRSIPSTRKRSKPTTPSPATTWPSSKAWCSSGVEEGEYELIALPLRIKGADASPVRAVLRTL